MAVYVDQIVEYPEKFISPHIRRYGREWCHLWADDEQELIAFATLIGLSSGWRERGGSQRWLHYDLTPATRQQAIEAGAIEKEFKVWLRENNSGT